jgi:heme exporter protein D
MTVDAGYHLWYIGFMHTIEGVLAEMMTSHNLMAQLKLLQEIARERIREKRKREANHLAFLAQLTHFGVCPCSAMGRYSTCCGSTTDGEAEP